MTERRVEQVMGMPVLVDVRDGTTGPDTLDRVFAWLRFVDATFSTYRPDSDVCRLDRGELAPADAHPLVREVLARCERLRGETGGFFDARAAGRLDPSGLVKGWAVDRAAALLSDAGASRFCVNAGGDVVVRGGPWRVGVQHPRQRDRVAAVLALTDAAVATSGAYERGEHIVDPLLRPAPPRHARRHRARPRPRDRRRLRDGGVRDGRARAGLDGAAAGLRRDDDPRGRPRALHRALPAPPRAHAQFAVTTSVCVPAPVSTVTSSPRFVARVSGVTALPSSTAVSTVEPAGSVCPIASVAIGAPTRTRVV